MANISQITIDNNTFDIKDTQARNGLGAKQDVLTPGQNISITKDTTTGETIISTTGGGVANIATTTTVGTVKPDNNTITVAEDGTISANKSIDVLSADPANPVSGQIWITVSSA